MNLKKDGVQSDENLYSSNATPSVFQALIYNDIHIGNKLFGLYLIATRTNYSNEMFCLSKCNIDLTCSFAYFTVQENVSTCFILNERAEEIVIKKIVGFTSFIYKRIRYIIKKKKKKNVDLRIKLYIN